MRTLEKAMFSRMKVDFSKPAGSVSEIKNSNWHKLNEPVTFTHRKVLHNTEKLL